MRMALKVGVLEEGVEARGSKGRGLMIVLMEGLPRSPPLSHEGSDMASAGMTFH